MNKTTILAGFLCFFACSKNSNAPQSPKELETIQSLEERVGQLEKQLSAIEEKVPVWDSVAEGVTQILNKLGNAPSRAKSPSPDPDKVYFVPIKGEPYMGAKNALVTIVKAYDFYCGYCDKARPTMDVLLAKYPKTLKVVLKEFVIHEESARQPALAACAAHKQGKFNAMYERIWEDGIRSRARLDKDDLLDIAKDLKLDIKKLRADMNGSCTEEVSLSQKELAKLGVRGTPAFFVNGRYLVGALPADMFAELIDEELIKAKKHVKNGVKASQMYDHIMKDASKTL